MKKLLLVSLCLVFGFTSSFAQLSKEEKKEWKAKYKQYKSDLEGFKELVEENGTLKSQLSSTKKELDGLKSKMSDKDATISDLQDENSRLKSQVAAAQAAASEARSALANKPAEQPSPMSMDGVVFKVQVGAFEKKDMSKFFDNNPMFSGETEDGMQKITLGFFRDYWEADTFKKYLREMGVKDAWIVPYKDGKRVPIKDVLEGVI
ncbi:MAG: Ezrin/radixin/moesin family protein [Cyclobacteriaceae bacterium]|nr:Ezrin/radixin/moesin family protein [Cyclobacteriaceae bacterium]